MKSKRINIRVSEREHIALIKTSKWYNVSISSIMRRSLYDFFENIETKDKKLKKIKKEMSESQEINLRTLEIRQKNYYLYIITNAYRAIWDFAGITMFNSGQPNMKIINISLDSYNKLYKKFPIKIRKALKPEMENLNKLRKKEFLLEKFKTYKLFRKLEYKPIESNE